MILGQLSAGDLARRLAGPGLAIRTGPFNIRMRSGIDSLQTAVALLYDRHSVVDEDAFCDFTLEIVPARGLRRWVRPQVRLFLEGQAPFEPLPREHAFPLLEWSMNWCISAQAHQYLLLHAAVVARAGVAMVLPAPPGSGKSTLCAGLIHRGWRLLSDEMALISLAGGELSALARPVSLKNESVRVIREFAPEAVFSAEARDTSKGTVAHLKPKADDVACMDEPARPRWIVFPRYLRDAPATLAPRPKADAMLELGRNAFNYALLGQTGFEVLGGVISASDCYDFTYSRLDEAIEIFDALFRQHRG